MAWNLLRRATGGVMPAALSGAPAKLTLMSLKADARVMAGVTTPLDADAYVIFNPW